MDRPRTPSRARLAAVALAGALLAGAVPLPAQTRPSFLGVTIDSATQQADRRLMDYLSRKVGVGFTHDELDYAEVIRRLVNWKPAEGFFVARTTPYVYVVSELLGARMDTLATYVSAATGRTTYHSYFVVSRRDFSRPPALADVLQSLLQRKTRPRFVFQSQFSASSYFLPSVFFRSNRIFQMPESTPPLTAIATELREGSSSRLVELVASGAADLAAVWDGTKARYEPGGADYATTGSQVYFVQLPTVLPDDLLVCSSDLDPRMKDRLHEAVAGMGESEIGVGDFRTWQEMSKASEARQALGDLRQVARASVAPVTVEIVTEPGAASTLTPGALVDAVQQAVRLSETEFVVFDQDFHEHADFRWTLQPIHDGAVRLRSAIRGLDIPEQTFQVSFRDVEDLTARLVSIIQTRQHRIRYVWPFSPLEPIVIRNSAFALVPGTPVTVQRITWLDPERNAFRAGQVFTAKIASTSFYRYELDLREFARLLGSDAKLDPMSTSGFRVILVRPADEPLLFRALTVALLALFGLAAASAAWTLVRSSPMRTPPPSASPVVRT